MNETFDFPSKRKSREMLFNFIRKNLKKKPEDMKVLCLPGPELLEVKEVYDKLGIPRKNITCVEYDRKIFEKLSSENHGVVLVNDDVVEYILNNSVNIHENIDVISLDFCGFFSNKQYHLIDRFFRNCLFSHDVVFFINNSVGHENEQSALDTTFMRKDELELNGRVGYVGIIERYENRLSRMANACAFSSFGVCEKEDLYEMLEYYNISVGVGERMFIDEEVRKIPITKHGQIAMPQDNMHDFVCCFNVLNYGTINITDSELFEYISNTTTKMYGDMVFYKYEPPLLLKMKNENIHYLLIDIIYACFGFGVPSKRFRKNIEKISSYRRMGSRCVYLGRQLKSKTRVFLGNDHCTKEKEKPQQIEKSMLDKNNIIAELKNGTRFYELNKRFGITKGQYAAYKAHITMGTY